MSAKTEQFLGLYKTYEGLVRAESEDPKAVEDHGWDVLDWS